MPDTWKSLLVDEQISPENVEKEAEVIVTAVILGFVATRYYQNQPCSFDIEHPTQQQLEQWADIDKAINKTERLLTEQQSRFQRLFNHYWIEGQRSLFQIQTPAVPGADATDTEDQKRLVKGYVEFLQEQNYDFPMVMDAMAEVLGAYDPEMKAFLKDGQSDPGFHGALITGRAGGQTLPFNYAKRSVRFGGIKIDLTVSGARNRQINSEVAKSRAEQIKRDSSGEGLYEGRGAYTGMIDNPVDQDKSFVESTWRFVDNNPERWHPLKGVAPDDARNRKPYFRKWGLIGVNKEKSDTTPQDSVNEKSRPEGLGSVPLDRVAVGNKYRIGYVHGLVSAAEQAVAWGPWCTPFEMSVGKDTTKMASCFPCTTYLYAAGFPPSSIHLGRGESWIPLSLEHLKPGDNRTIQPDFFSKLASRKENINSLAARWHTEVFHYMRLGQRILEKAFLFPLPVINQNLLYTTAITNLGEKTSRIHSNPEMIAKQGGNLFLDAITVHATDWKRIKNTLKPAYDAVLAAHWAEINKDKDTRILEQRSREQKTALAQNFNNSYETSSDTALSAFMSSPDNPVLLNGMKVIFDEPVSVYPVTLESKAEVRRNDD